MPDVAGLAVGTEAPSFTGSLVEPSGDTVDRALSDLYAERPVLLSFYTIDFSPDCMDEWCAFRDFDWFASGDHVQVIGASKSPAWLHARFIAHLGLNFPLYADTSLELAEKFGVKYRAFKLSTRSRRSCFLIDTDGIIRYRWVGEHPLDPTRDVPPVDEVHEAVRTELDLPPAESFGFGDV
jgi:peroxiredoxin Q/BCP